MACGCSSMPAHTTGSETGLPTNDGRQRCNKLAKRVSGLKPLKSGPLTGRQWASSGLTET